MALHSPILLNVQINSINYLDKRKIVLGVILGTKYLKKIQLIQYWLLENNYFLNIDKTFILP